MLNSFGFLASSTMLRCSLWCDDSFNHSVLQLCCSFHPLPPVVTTLIFLLLQLSLYVAFNPDTLQSKYRCILKCFYPEAVTIHQLPRSVARLSPVCFLFRSLLVGHLTSTSTTWAMGRSIIRQGLLCLAKYWLSERNVKKGFRPIGRPA